jgi:hypothetical protein
LFITPRGGGGGGRGRAGRRLAGMLVMVAVVVVLLLRCVRRLGGVTGHAGLFAIPFQPVAGLLFSIFHISAGAPCIRVD